METYSEMAKTITALSPRMACFKAAVQGHVDTARRCFTDVGTYLEPTKVLGSSVGISSAYAASLHGDPTDVGFTVAFVGKCGPTKVCACDPRGCSQALFAPRPHGWREGALYCGGVPAK